MNHVPVLLNEVVHTFSYLSNLKEGYFVDGTIGNAGHSLAIARRYKLQDTRNKVIAIDKDLEAIDIAKRNIKTEGLDDIFTFVHDNFKNIEEILNPLNIQKVNGVLLDLGVSSMQLDDKNRGFSFQNLDQDLDMRMDQTQSFSVKDIVNGYSKKEIERILKEYGEERHARKIAENITLERKENPIKTVGQLISILEKTIPKKEQFGKIHFATKTFQALRIETNKELEGLSHAIKKYADILEDGARLAIISFHSLEDRIVKLTFYELSNPCHCPKDMPCACGKKPKYRIVNKKPIIASDKEIMQNPRSRSAKLRVIERLNS